MLPLQERTGLARWGGAARQSGGRASGGGGENEVATSQHGGFLSKLRRGLIPEPAMQVLQMPGLVSGDAVMVGTSH